MASETASAEAARRSIETLQLLKRDARIMSRASAPIQPGNFSRPTTWLTSFVELSALRISKPIATGSAHGLEAHTCLRLFEFREAKPPVITLGLGCRVGVLLHGIERAVTTNLFGNDTYDQRRR
jgi:hypothetical protein